MTAALGGEWSAARPGHTLPPGRTWYPFYRRMGGPQGRSGRAENLVPTEIRSRTAQSVVSRYTNWATRPTVEKCNPWIICTEIQNCPSRWPRGLRRRFAAVRLLRLWVRIPPGSWMSVCCECGVLSGKCLCDELITRTEESCWQWCVVVCDLETSWMRRLWPIGGCYAKRKKNSRLISAN